MNYSVRILCVQIVFERMVMLIMNKAYFSNVMMHNVDWVGLRTTGSKFLLKYSSRLSLGKDAAIATRLLLYSDIS